MTLELCILGVIAGIVALAHVAVIVGAAWLVLAAVLQHSRISPGLRR